jgi:transcriptional regulator with GAF, ATPase, and Fis domain
MARDEDLAAAFVDLADTLVSDYDVTDLLYRLVEHCVHLLDVSEAGLLLSDQRGSLNVMASTNEQTRLLELFQVQSDEGPCLEAYHTGQPVAVDDLTAVIDRWPRFAPAAIAQGYAAVHALPLRLRETIIGALNLFNTHTGALPEDDAHIARALADVATIGILQERAIHRGETIVEQLEGALHSRVLIEQAKGVLAERGQLDMNEAFQRLRAYARSTNIRLSNLAAHVINGQADANAILATTDTPPNQPSRNALNS